LLFCSSVPLAFPPAVKRANVKVSRTVEFLFACVDVTGSVTSRGERRLRALPIMVVRRIFGTRREARRGGC